MAAKRKTPAASSGILPQVLRDYFVRRLTDVTGWSLLGLATFMALAVLSFNPADPSLNHAVDNAPSNLLGATGAITADLLIQFLGLAAALPVLVLFAWGVRILLGRDLPRPTRRVVLLTIVIAATAFSLTVLDRPGIDQLGAYPGGAVGVLLLRPVSQFGTGLGLTPGMLATGTAAIAILLGLYVLGITPGEWRHAGRAAAGGARVSAAATGRAARLGATAARRGARFVSEARARGRSEPRLRVEKPRLAKAASSPRAAEAPGKRAPLVESRPPEPRLSKRAKSGRQKRLDLPIPTGEYELPPLDLLTTPPHDAKAAEINEEGLEENARLLESVLEDFGIRGEIVKVRPGPVVTLYELEPAPGTKTSRVISLADDIARSMSAVAVRIAVVPGRNAIGIELPNNHREMVHLQELLACNEFERSQSVLTLALGKDIGGTPVVVDLARMPHLLIAGTTGSGKSVGVNSMILSLLYRLRPDQCRFIMIDPKMLELSVYDGIPHLLAPVVTDAKKAVVALKWVVREMENRYRSMSKLGVRNVAGYNQRLERARSKGEIIQRRVQTGFDPDTGKPVYEEQALDTTPLPHIVVIVDEMADLMLVAGKDVEAAIQRLAQMARAAGIHLIMATQRPSVDVVTGTIKANFPTRISFQVTSKIDSRTILGEQGAEQLLGMGDMLNMVGGGRITRVHGPFVSDAEVEDVVAFLKQQGEPDYIDQVTDDDDVAAGIPGFEISKLANGGGSGNELYDQAVALVTREGRASTSFVQRHLQIGYNRAARLIEQMEKEGVISTANHVGKREVLAGAPPEDYPED